MRLRQARMGCIHSVMSMVVQYRGGGSFAAASEDQERGRLGNLGTCGTGDPSFSGEHGLRVVRGFISVLNAAKDDDKERVCSGVSVATRPAGEREKLRRRTKPGRAGARGASRDRSGGGGVDGVAGGASSKVKPPLWRLLGVTSLGATSVGVFGSKMPPRCPRAPAASRRESHDKTYRTPQRTPGPPDQHPTRPFAFFTGHAGPRGARQHRITRPP